MLAPRDRNFILVLYLSNFSVSSNHSVTLSSWQIAVIMTCLELANDEDQWNLDGLLGVDWDDVEGLLSSAYNRLMAANI